MLDQRHLAAASALAVVGPARRTIRTGPSKPLSSGGGRSRCGRVHVSGSRFAGAPTPAGRSWTSARRRRAAASASRHRRLSSVFTRVLHLAQLAHRPADLACDLGQPLRPEDEQRDDEMTRISGAPRFMADPSWALGANRTGGALPRYGAGAPGAGGVGCRRAPGRGPAGARGRRVERFEGARHEIAHAPDRDQDRGHARDDDHEREHRPEHARTLSLLAVQRSADLIGDRLEPVVLLEQQVEVEEVVGRERRPGPALAEFGRAAARLACARRSRRAGRRCAGSLPWPLRARQSGHRKQYEPRSSSAQTRTVRVFRRQLDVTAARAIRPDRRHCSPSPLVSCLDRLPWRLTYPSAGRRGWLETPGPATSSRCLSRGSRPVAR